MPHQLKRLKFDRVDLVDSGANPDAHIMLAKRDVGASSAPAPTLLQRVRTWFGKQDHTEHIMFAPLHAAHEATEDLWCMFDALRTSIDSIVRCDAPDKGALLKETLQQFFEACLKECAEAINEAPVAVASVQTCTCPSCGANCCAGTCPGCGAACTDAYCTACGTCCCYPYCPHCGAECGEKAAAISTAKSLRARLVDLASAGDAIAKEGRVLSALNLKRLEAAMETLKEMLDTMKLPDQAAEEPKQAEHEQDRDAADHGTEKGATTMKLADVLKRLGLDPEKEVDVARTPDRPQGNDPKLADEIAKKLEALEQTATRVSELQKRADEADKRAEHAETIAKAERELRVAAEFRKSAEGFSRVPGSVDEKAAMLRKAFETSEEEGRRVEQWFRSVQEQLSQNDALLKEWGRPGVAGQHIDGEAELDAMARALVAKDASITYEQAYARVLKSPEGLAAYERVTKGMRKGAN